MILKNEMKYSFLLSRVDRRVFLRRAHRPSHLIVFQLLPCCNRSSSLSSGATIQHLSCNPTHCISARPFLLSLLSSCTHLRSLEKIHALFVTHGLAREDLSCQTKLLSCYGSFHDNESARMVFDRIPQRDTYSWKVMLRWYVLNGQYAEAVECYCRMRSCLRMCDNFVFSLVLKACVKLSDFDEGKKVHGHIVKVGSPDCFLVDCLIDMYVKGGELDCARRLFDDTQDRNVVSWTSIISGYVQNERAEEALLLFNEMRWTSVELNEYTITCMFTACTLLDSLHQGKWAHGCMIKLGMRVNSVVGTSLLDMYVKCGEIADAYSVFKDLDNVDIVSWTAMIVGYTQKGHPTEALELFSQRNSFGLIPNSVTIASALSASAQLRTLNFGTSVHGLATKLGATDCLVVTNALVDMYSKCCMILEAKSMFDIVPSKDLVTWNAMAAGYSQNDMGREALLLVNEMRVLGCSPDAVSVVSALSACVCLGDLIIGSSFHAYASKCGFLQNVHVSTALLNFYNKCGDVMLANRVFDEMSKRNSVTLCAMLGGYGMQGDSPSSINLLSKMLKEDLQANDATLTSILTTCSHTGMVDEGQELFSRMTEHFNIRPSMKHYGCMVDMLARAGKLDEALKFIERMPMPAEVSVWAAFIHGCRLHSRLALGEFAVRKMMELFPETSDYYVLMSNLYASDGRWDEASDIRKLMKERGLIKMPGCSSTSSRKLC